MNEIDEWMVSEKGAVSLRDLRSTITANVSVCLSVGVSENTDGPRKDDASSSSISNLLFPVADSCATNAKCHKPSTPSNTDQASSVSNPTGIVNFLLQHFLSDTCNQRFAILRFGSERSTCRRNCEGYRQEEWTREVFERTFTPAAERISRSSSGGSRVAAARCFLPMLILSWIAESGEVEGRGGELFDSLFDDRSKR